MLEGRVVLGSLLSPPVPFLQVFIVWVCFGLVVFSCSWPDGLCGERCQIMKPVSKAGI